MLQTKLGSFYEALINVLVGYTINFAMNLVILNGIFNLGISLVQNLYIGVLFTFVSVARSYLIRRYFNHRLQQLAARLAGESK